MLHVERNTISTQSKELVRIVRLKMFTKRLEDTAAFYDAREESLMSELSAATTESTGLDRLLDGVRTEMADLQKRSGAGYTVIRFIIEDSCSTLGPSLRTPNDNFCVAPNE